jgi:hypothetical protein
LDGWGGAALTELQAKVVRFETLIADCELIAKLATDGAKRKLYLGLALHYRELVGDLRHVIAIDDHHHSDVRDVLRP